ncbi:hypothetical protein EIP86_001572 [Pleurotus ostreatoroseus]|nr:hypothetical protein EIP86_001572 [Pleurotus ostreatoroseus]
MQILQDLPPSILRQLQLMGIDHGQNQHQLRAVGGALDMTNRQPRTQMMSQLGGMPQVQGIPAIQPSMPQIQLRERATILQQGSPAAGVPQQQQQMSGGIAPNGQMSFRRPTPELQQRAMKVVLVLREQFRAWHYAERAIPENERNEFMQDFEKLHDLADQVDDKMCYYACFLGEDEVRKVLLVITTVKKQLAMLSGGVQRFIMDTKQIRECQLILSVAITHVQDRLSQIRDFELQEMQQGQAQ